MDDDRLAPFGFIVFCLVIGTFLIFIPWHALWETNFLLHYIPSAGSIVLNNYFRGAVSGLGVVDVLIGLAEFARLMKTSRKGNLPHPEP